MTDPETSALREAIAREAALNREEAERFAAKGNYFSANHFSAVAQGNEDVLEFVAPLEEAVARLRAERDAARAALEWYGEQARLCRLIHSEGDSGRHALSDDGGKRARSALSRKQPDEEAGKP